MIRDSPQNIGSYMKGLLCTKWSSRSNAYREHYRITMVSSPSPTSLNLLICYLQNFECMLARSLNNFKWLSM